MFAKNLMLKILAGAGTVLISIPVLAPVFFSKAPRRGASLFLCHKIHPGHGEG